MSFTRTGPMALRTLRSASLSLSVRPLPSLAVTSGATRSFSSASPVRMVVSSVRYDSRQPSRSAWAKNPIIKYEELKPLTQQPTDNVLLVDVREPDEVALGSIPSAVNLPLSRLKDALDRGFNAGDFQKEFAFSKPTYDQNIIFFCRSGKRSANAAELASERGYPNIRNYQGSWLDWSKREGEGDKDD
ncbi:hypothetical protein CI109_102362 [Kwoniella shandongensis]|uniref:Uncharacterized protein n=1 Tax=Kwoniella shandongensis TaxID=1734106 RepID=A0A5M6C1D9_9TREE|nr:uncharacterized protein CI109_003320 [Kwoniella shandongensis]KAA5528420.1 hypothetical protein CI109_003320 [Kwoniella shandongensis]